MPAGPDFRYTDFSNGRGTPRKPVKRHNCRFHWLTRDVPLVFGPLMPAGPDFRYTHFSGGRGSRILPAHTFRVSEVSHFTYTHFSGVRGVAFYLLTYTHTFLGDS